jgi:predicted MFS family arabinose efflux permease
VPIAVLTAFAALRLVTESRSEHRTSYDIRGAITSTAGLVSLVYGFTRAESDGWTAAATLTLVGVGLALLAAFVWIERRTESPLLPLRVVLDRNRGGSFLASLLAGIAMFATFLFLTFYYQQTLHYSALRTGFAFLPFSIGIIAGATLASRFLPRTGPRPLMVVGLALGVVGLVLFHGVGVHTVFLTGIMPAELIVSFGMGMAFVPMNSTALIGVDPSDAGVASALMNTTQQTGGSLGVSLLNTLAASATSSYLADHAGRAAAQAAAVVHGYTTAFAVSAGLLGLGAVISLVMLRAGRADLPAELEVMAAA